MSAYDSTLGVKLADILDGYQIDSPVPEITLQKMTANTAELKEGDAFLALNGVSRHGIDFALNAEQAKASVVLFDSTDEYAKQRLVLLNKQMSIPLLGVAHLNRVHGEILSRCYGEPSKQMQLIGVTGTDGKSSVTHLLVQAFTRLGLSAASIGTLGIGIANDLKPNSHTTPDAGSIQSYLADFLQQKCEIVVMEVSSHALHQYRVEGCAFDIALLTNLSSDHLDYHQDIKHYAAAKEQLFHWDTLSARVLNGDDKFGQALTSKFDASSVVAYSANQDKSQSTVYLKSVEKKDRLKVLTIETPKGELIVETQLIGDFNIDNILALVSTLVALDYDLKRLQKACHLLTPIPGRMEQIASLDGKQVIVDFAHTEQALTASLKAAKDQTNGQLWCVFGCGGDRDRSKRAPMGRIAERYADYLVITDDNPRSEDPQQIVNDILQGCAREHHIVNDRKAAIEFAVSKANQNDTVLIAGKGHENFQIVGDKKIPFRDQVIASEALQVSYD
ncbi:MAG: UDP-N-acetylmuramoyl-L-alanyl-D-glutamate--2,6-diaminopimelate ligase [Gammaproteobacteria bacterium]|nr:UDP-N-acetylmuramoyl-L-alanyl-D-glutamate--2,6-diaminopimelate ligase [Gammaproteobacteria bacterium]